MGEEYSQTEMYFSYLEQKESLEKEIKQYIERRKKLINENPTLYETVKQNVITNENEEYRIQIMSLNFEINTRLEKYNIITAKLKIHYNLRTIIFYLGKTLCL